MPEPQLVDRFGQPISSAALLDAPPLRRSSRKPPVFNPEPERLKTLLKTADDGDPREVQQLCADLEGRDGHFGGVLETRRRAVTRLTWRTPPPTRTTSWRSTSSTRSSATSSTRPGTGR